METQTIEKIHEQNLKFIEVNKLKVGDHINLLDQYKTVKQCQIISIHMIYGWILARDIKDGFDHYNVDINKICAIYTWQQLKRVEWMRTGTYKPTSKQDALNY